MKIKIFAEESLLLAFALLLAFVLCLTACNQPKPADKPVEVVYKTGLIKPTNRTYGMPFVRHAKPRALPDAFSWEEQGFATPVMSQGNCGSCWAFGSTQQMDMGYKIFAHKSISFSEQDLVGRLFHGCNGGYFANDDEVKTGQTDNTQCPYQADDSTCPSSSTKVGKGISWGMVGQQGRPPTDDEMKTAIMANGAIAVTMGADNSFMRYGGGIPDNCYSSSTNHIVALTGWKTVSGKTYFHLKNSWGESWGEKGYGWFPLGCYSIGEEAAYLSVAAVPCHAPSQRLPAQYIVSFNDTVLLGVRAVVGTTYEWYRGPMKLGDGAELEIQVKEEMVLTLKEHNECGDADVLTQITIKQ